MAAALLALCVFFYRFDPLGGSFGGFDNDHFLQFALAKQVEAGAQPLRDFSDAVQGAWPSLTYELSAAAQRWLGDNFLSEALLTVAGVTAAAVVTFVTACRLAPWPWALALTVLSVMLSPKLYSYPKVLVLSVATLLIVRYAERATTRAAIGLGVWTAVAFLFRHDYAVYCGTGFLTVLLASHLGDRPLLVRRAGIYAAVSVVLLLPSIWWVHHYAGLGEYVRNALEISARETDRTRLNEWPPFALEGIGSPMDFLWREENTRATLYYFLLALPVVGAAAAIVRWSRAAWRQSSEVIAVLAFSALTGITAKFFLRGNLEARFSEVAPAAVVLGAALLAWWTERESVSRASRVARHAVAFVVVGAITACIVIQQNVPAEFLSARLTTPVSAVRQAAAVFSELRTLPAAMREQGPPARMQAADYVHRCTKATDRVLVFAYAPEVEVFADRQFAGGRAVFAPGYYAREKYSHDALNWLSRESVPIIIAEPDEKSELYERFPLLAEYFAREYQDVGSVMMSEGAFRVFVSRRHVPTGTGVNGLPCFS